MDSRKPSEKRNGAAEPAHDAESQHPTSLADRVVEVKITDGNLNALSEAGRTAQQGNEPTPDLMGFIAPVEGPEDVARVRAEFAKAVEALEAWGIPVAGRSGRHEEKGSPAKSGSAQSSASKSE